MADLRRWILALAVLSLFVGLASAQSGGSTNPGITCTTDAAPVSIRQEGVTELVGDITIRCSGGPILAPGASIPQVNIVVTLPQNVTSRIVSGTNITDSLLLIDEPGASSGATIVLPGWGPALPITVCATPASGCSAIAGVSAATGSAGGPLAGVPATVAVTPNTTPTSGVLPASAAPNAYQGVVSGTQLTFFGVPVLAPVTTGVQRIFRITNLRMNANPTPLLGLVNASVATSNFTVLPVNQASVTVAQTQQGLIPTVTLGSSSLTQCVSIPSTAPVLASTLVYTEGFGTAFKTRFDPSKAPSPTTPGSAFNTAFFQNLPNIPYNSESGLTLPSTTPSFNTTTNTAGTVGSNLGLADFGTRLKAVFTNLPAGARIWVSPANLNTGTVTTLATAGANSVGPFAYIVTSETAADSASGIPAGTPGSNGLVEITPPTGSTTATAVWEVLNTNPNAIEHMDFGVYISYTANQSTNTPPAGNSQVGMSFAPSSTTPVTTASSTQPIPRFLDNSTPKTAFTIIACRSILLFPFVTNTNGFDTGIAISNTSTDPFGTTPQAGNCQLYFYGGTGQPTTLPINVPSATGAIATGTSYAFTASSLAPGFSGYMFAVCNFQFAHGFAFVSQFGNAFNGTMGYLALTVPDPSIYNLGKRLALSNPNAGVNNGVQTGEQLSQ